MAHCCSNDSEIDNVLDNSYKECNSNSESETDSVSYSSESEFENSDIEESSDNANDSRKSSKH